MGTSLSCNIHDEDCLLLRTKYSRKCYLHSLLQKEGEHEHGTTDTALDWLCIPRGVIEDAGERGGNENFRGTNTMIYPSIHQHSA